MLLKSCLTSEPLHHYYPGDYQERSDDAREAGLVHRNPDQAEVVDHYRGENLPGEDQPDSGRGAETRGEDYRGEDEQGAEQTSRPRPPRRAGDRAWQRPLHHQRGDAERDRDDDERNRGGGQGPADEGPQLAVDAELHGQDDFGRERDRQQDPGHPHYYRGS